jgi:hypothetical protein
MFGFAQTVHAWLAMFTKPPTRFRRRHFPAGDSCGTVAPTRQQAITKVKGEIMDANDATRDNFGMYANTNVGPCPELMGANTLLGNDVYNKDGEDLRDIKDFMINMASGRRHK